MATPQSQPLYLPPIELESLPEATKDYILSKAAATNQSPLDVIRDILRRAASRAGFPVSDTAASSN